MRALKANIEATQTRQARLRAYFGAQVLNGHDFVCRHSAACASSCRAGVTFYPVQLHHVGSHYDLLWDGRPFRVVMVGQEAGHGDVVDLDQRRALILDRVDHAFTARNAHIAGTTTLLRLLFGRDPGTDRDGEVLDLHGEPVHLFEAFALVNFLLCSAVDGTVDRTGRREGGKGRSSPTMRRNCAAHFRAAIDILEPTVLVAQGFDVRRWIGRAYGWPRWTREPVERVVVGGRRTLLLSFAHPSASGRYGWWGRSPRSPYLIETVVPAIRSALADR